jgi:hypothetical protein
MSGVMRSERHASYRAMGGGRHTDAGDLLGGDWIGE